MCKWFELYSRWVPLIVGCIVRPSLGLLTQCPLFKQRTREHDFHLFLSSDACIIKEAESKSVNFFFQVQDIGILSHG